MTVRALRKGIVDSPDAVSIGAGDNTNRLFVLKGGADAGKSAFVEMGQVDETQLKFSSREAGDLHRALTPAVVVAPVVPVVAQGETPAVVEAHSHGAKSM